MAAVTDTTSIAHIPLSLAAPKQVQSPLQGVFNKAAAGFLQLPAAPLAGHREVEHKAKAAELPRIRPQIISKKEFDAKFAGASDVPLCQIEDAGIPLCTTSAAICVAVVAISYKKGIPHEVGMLHYDSDQVRLGRFLEEMNNGKVVVHLYIAGGFTTDQEAFLGIIKDFKPKTKIIYKKFNPSDVDQEIYYKHSEYLDRHYSFAISMGITKNFEIYIADETEFKKKKSNKDFVNFNEVIAPHLRKCDDCMHSDSDED